MQNCRVPRRFPRFPEGTPHAICTDMSPLRILVPSALIACAACTGALPPPAPVEAQVASHTEVTVDPQVPCDLVCEQALAVARKEDPPDYNARATANANQVLEAMHADLLACYATRVAANPDAHGFLTVDIVIGPDGHVQRVETTGGAVLGPVTMRCLTKRVERGVFEPPHGGGTLTIHVPFSLRRADPEEST
jgi:hypothetical protein